MSAESFTVEEKMDLAHRKRQIRELLATADLADPTPPPTLRTESGPVPSRYVPCTLCRKTGRVAHPVLPSRTRFCPSCDGSGWRRRRKGEDVYDGVMRVPIRVATTQSQDAIRPFRLDEDIRRLDGLLLRLEGEVSDERQDLADEVIRFQRRRHQLEREGSYRPLSQAMLTLRSKSRCVWKAVVASYPLDIPVAASAHQKRLEDLGVEYLSQLMPDRIVVPEWAVERVRKLEELRSVLELRDTFGWGAKRIAAATKLPERKVRLILKGQLTAAPSDPPATIRNTAGANPSGK